MRELSKRQAAVFDFVCEQLESSGISPTYREIGEHMGITSTNGVSDHVRALIRKGYLRRLPSKGGSLARALVLGEQGLAARGQTPSVEDQMVEVHVYGRVVAGLPAFAVENLEETLRVDRCMLPDGATVFALKVYGESMIEDGIMPGDYLFVRKQLNVRNGEIAVVMVDGEATVKRFFREKGRIRLQPANSQMAPIYVMDNEFSQVDVLGSVVGVYRRI